MLTSDEAPNCKLATLARVLHASVQPTHRALDDARATVDVLHVLFERLGGLGVHSLEELRTFTGQVTAQQRSKRHLAEVMPHSPGVYVFRDERGRVLYVGKAKDLRTRVRTYFTSSEMRQRIIEMVAIAHDVTPIVCSTDLEAQVRELRLIAQHKPPYNRRSKFPERSVWVKLTVEPFPRLSIVPWSEGRQRQLPGSVLIDPLSGARRCGGPRSRADPAVSRAAASAASDIGVCPCRDGQMRSAVRRQREHRRIRRARHCRARCHRERCAGCREDVAAPHRNAGRDAALRGCGSAA